MTDTITLTGLVGTEPRHLVTSEGLHITTFRLASNQRRFDRSKQQWVDADTNWYTISTFRQLAIHASTSINRGDRVIVTGRLKVREWDTGERKGIAVDVEADTVGHDLMWGTAVFARVISPNSTVTSPADDDAPAPAEEPEGLDPEAAMNDHDDADDRVPAAIAPF